MPALGRVRRVDALEHRRAGPDLEVAVGVVAGELALGPSRPSGVGSVATWPGASPPLAEDGNRADADDRRHGDGDDRAGDAATPYGAVAGLEPVGAPAVRRLGAEPLAECFAQIHVHDI